MDILGPLKKPGDAVGSRTLGIPDGIWALIMGGLLILVVGVIGLIAGQPWLLPSLGPSALIIGVLILAIIGDIFRRIRLAGNKESFSK